MTQQSGDSEPNGELTIPMISLHDQQLKKNKSFWLKKDDVRVIQSLYVQCKKGWNITLKKVVFLSLLIDYAIRWQRNC